ncbi:Gfo/Idh/MocA family protein [Rhizobacter sp. LjRoot28]|uniref:Gfo/Idh/MocA family protein n=1 Tax=Rhizobacter sp. LjRoot28 TaxID=3342309 RepID=UPI003ECF1DEE
MRILMIGTGSIGRRHMASLRSLVPEARFDVLREAGRSTDVSALDGATVSTSLDEAFGKQPRLVVVASPSSLHLKYLSAAIDHGVPFYAEKPVVSDVFDLEALQRHLRGRDLPPNIVGCNLRFLPSLQLLAELMADGRLGRVVRASFEAGQWLPDWRPAQDYRQSYSARRALGGGVLLDLIHEVDAARWLLGDFTEVHAEVGHLSSLNIETEDTACLLMRSGRGPLATVQLDYVHRRPFRRYRVVGDEGTAEWDLPSRTLTLTTSNGVSPFALPDSAFNVAATYPAAMAELLAAVREGRPTSQPLSEGLASVELVLRARARDIP